MSILLLCSDILQVYRHNFIPSASSSSNALSNSVPESRLKEVLLEGVKLSELDGTNAADIWTMSPPCQPFTTTRGAQSLGTLDTRNKGLFFLLQTLLELELKPRWILLENVAAFGSSDVLHLTKKVLSHCGYTYEEFLLSPITCVGVPNHRLRYYLSCFRKESFDGRLAGLTAEEAVDGVHRSLPSLAFSHPHVRCIGDYLLAEESMPPSELAELMLTKEVLGATWAAARISIVGRFDTTSFCFTKGYGRQMDRSTGSCLFIDAPGPLAEDAYRIDRSSLLALEGRVRLFHPGLVTPILP